MNPKLSVIVPVYRTEDYLKECIESLIAQPYRDLEILLVDDASPDNCGKICDAYAQKHSFIKVIHKEHGGLVHTRKTGLTHASGDYITFVDSDDFIEPDMFEMMMKRITETGADICICGIIIEDDGKRTPMYDDMTEGLYDKTRLEQEVYPQMLFSETLQKPLIAPSLCNKIFRKDIIAPVLSMADDRIVYGEDASCTYPCMLDSKSVYVLQKGYYIYRQTNTSITKKYDPLLLDKILLLVETLERECSKRQYDVSVQLDNYAAVQLLFAVRGELLHNKELPPAGRVKKLKAYLSEPRFERVYETVRNGNLGKKVKTKIRLAEKKQLYLLFLLCFFKEKVLQLKGHYHEG